MSRQPFVPTPKQRDQVEALTGLLVPQETVARFLEIDVKTLRKHFRSELDHGREKVAAKLKGVLFHAAAREGSVRAATYLCDRMGLWPVPETAAAEPQQLRVVVTGGLRAVEEEITVPGRQRPPGGFQGPANE